MLESYCLSVVEGRGVGALEVDDWFWLERCGTASERNLRISH